MIEKERFDICKKNRVDMRIKRYMVYSEVFQVILGIGVSILISFFCVPTYISQLKFIVIVILALLVDVLFMIISLVRIEKYFFFYNKETENIEIYEKQISSKYFYIPIKHIKFVSLSQNAIQKKWI